MDSAGLRVGTVVFDDATGKANAELSPSSASFLPLNPFLHAPLLIPLSRDNWWVNDGRRGGGEASAVQLADRQSDSDATQG